MESHVLQQKEEYIAKITQIIYAFIKMDFLKFLQYVYLSME